MIRTNCLHRDSNNIVRYDATTADRSIKRNFHSLPTYSSTITTYVRGPVKNIRELERQRSTKKYIYTKQMFNSTVSTKSSRASCLFSCTQPTFVYQIVVITIRTRNTYPHCKFDDLIHIHSIYPSSPYYRARNTHRAVFRIVSFHQRTK